MHKKAKLRLSSETVRTLTSRDLAGAMGGDNTGVWFTESCTSCPIALTKVFTNCSCKA